MKAIKKFLTAALILFSITAVHAQECITLEPWQNQYSVCGSGQFSFQVTSGGSAMMGNYQWYVLGQWGYEPIPGATSWNYQTGTLYQSFNYKVDYDPGFGCQLQVYEFVAGVETEPPPLTPINATLCGGGTATIGVQYDGVSTYNWYESNGTLLQRDVPGATLTTGEPYQIIGLGYSQLQVSNVTTQRTFIVEKIPTSGGNCYNNGGSTTVYIYVNALPTAEIGAGVPASVCISDAPFALTTGTPSGGTWYINGVQTNTFNPSALGAGTKTVRYVYTDANGCTDDAVKTVQVGPAVSAGPMFTCSSSVAFELTNASPPGGTWSGAHVNSSLRIFNANSAGAGTHSVSYTYTSGGCTVVKSTTVNVSLNSMPAEFPYDIVQTNTICGGGSANLVVDNGQLGGGGIQNGNISHYLWFTSDWQPILNVNGQLHKESTYQTPHLTASATYMVRAVFNDGCESQSGWITAAINVPAPAPTLKVEPNCGGRGYGYVRIENPSASYTWHDENMNPLDFTTAPPGSINYSLNGAGTELSVSGIPSGVSVTVLVAAHSIPSCPSSPTQATIQYKANPVVTLSGIPAFRCVNDGAFTLAGGSPAGGLYSVDNGPPVTVFNSGAGNHTIRYTYTDPDGCSGTDQKSILVGPDVVAPAKTTCSSNLAVELSASPAGGTWGGPHVNSSLGLFNAYAAGAGVHNLSYTYTQNGCTVVKPTTVTVNANTPQQFPATAVQVGGPICGSGAANLAVDLGQFSGGGMQSINADHFLWYHNNEPVTVNGLLHKDYQYQTPLLSASTNYEVRAVFYDGCESLPYDIPVVVTPVPQLPVVQVEPNCDGRGYAFVRVQNPSGMQYIWYDQNLNPIDFTQIPPGEIYYSSNPERTELQVHNIVSTDPVTVYVSAEQANCISGQASAQILPETGPVSISAPDKLICGSSGNINMTASGPGLILFHWYQPGSTNVWQQGAEVNSGNLTASKTFTVIGYNAVHCPIGDNVLVKVSPKPGAPMVSNVEVCAWEPVPLFAYNVFNGASVNWFKPGATSPSAVGLEVQHPPLWENGTFNFTAVATNEDGCLGDTQTSFTVTVVEDCDERLNWVQATAFDASGAVVSKSRTYFDDAGKTLQGQTYSPATQKIFASQTISDKLNRQVLSTLPAPINESSFRYHWDFALDASGQLYGIEDFDTPSTKFNPAPLGDDQSGTLGWYYSANNTLEPYTPKTSFPYSRTEFYDDGFGEVRRGAAAGEHHRLGSDHEVLSGTFPVYSELDDYLAKRAIALPGLNQPVSMKGLAVQSISRDQNGKFGLSIADKAGRTVLAARALQEGESSADALHVVNTVTATETDPMIYFYLVQPQNVLITPAPSSVYVVEDIVSGQSITPPVGAWPGGFYRLVLTSGSVTVQYANDLIDVSYQFYDDAGRLRSSISPNGFNAWDSPADYSIIDKTTYTYNHQGMLLSSTEPDAGTSNYVYRKDGSIRFSQNAQQLADNKFSYTHYDKIGRPVESGEYRGSSLAFVAMTAPGFSTSAMNAEVEKIASLVTWTNADIKDWVRTHYDLADASIPNLPAGYEQEFVNGAISWTENINIKTWYSYDERGRVKWMAQKPAALIQTFLSEYQYDFLGNVLQVTNTTCINGDRLYPFFHHYEYDASKRLSKVYTSTDGSQKILRGTYEYYLHGPLKRIELGNNIQGIDFVYNIHGWLTQINHPEKDATKDPGGDSNDAFGMILDYYESALTDLFQTSMVPSSLDPHRHHRLSDPNKLFNESALHSEIQLAFSTGENDWRQSIKEAWQKTDGLNNQASTGKGSGR
jgi:hypothetical protein